ncbi:MAG: hypothetical protein E5Y32_11995 [Mesorhizobium sp.]|jgi:hypothetical protein|uniref:hypothetical protein n=1 Tax=Mesorhizobium sp. TaxID=1871066 RepID=UPI001207E954|nr:hypothetical protein [Mesorhizobium sp.]TIL60788.1 MAG: hypothetical protein E5Y79_09140 [Mesorhizobium sp.]TIL90844.1 MAG: hypothetical protein E5Y73_18485 [Mesorhizobium sp.]TIM13153.1 MAG: hypothetical protein E5Y67_18905 [Mesorhizobium sp.]TIN45955.1 MAG: hypothetical protein E5Y32_11995 [Mesorhizobium sp.]
MAGGKFDNTVTLAGNFWVEWPEGPLFHKIGETVIRVEVWLMQKSTGAIQMTYQTANLNLGGWRADEIWWPRDPLYPGYPPRWDGVGRFQRGPAMGTAVAIATSGLNQSYYWWSEEVEII